MRSKSVGEICATRHVAVLTNGEPTAEILSIPCVRAQKLQRTALRILLIFGQKLDIDILRKLTKPFFRKKIF